MSDPYKGDQKHSTFATTVFVVVTAVLLTGVLWLLIDSNRFAARGP